jgi:basic membrane lipoprotein Med (substrate-binding protein (PBP1-ABC) superfamily)
LLKKDKYKLVIDSDLYNTREIVQFAQVFPNTKFVLIDDNVEKPSAGSNLTVTCFDQQAKGFIMGILAAKKAKGTVGIVSMQDSIAGIDLLIGIKAGVQFINPKLKIIEQTIPNVYSNFRAPYLATGQLYDETAAAADKAILNRAEILIQDWPVSLTALIDTAAKANIAVVGGQSISLVTGTSRDKAVLGCVEDDYVRSTYDVIKAMVDGKLQGGKIDYNFANNGLRVIVNDKNIKSEIDKLIVKLNSGEIKVK